MATASPFLSLPAELRNRIYDFYFDPPSSDPPPAISCSPLALPWSCRQLSAETRAFAVPATTFKARCWRLWELRASFAEAPPSLLSDLSPIKRLELIVPIAEFLHQTSALQGLRFAEAGLTGLEELYIQYTGQHASEEQESQNVNTLEVVLWRTVAKCMNDNLRKVRIVHGGAFRDHCVAKFYQRMARLPQPFTSEQHWWAEQNVEEGRFFLVQDASSTVEQRRVAILLGHTVREAEKYALVRKQLREGRILENVLARRPNIGDAVELDGETLAYEIEQLSRSFNLSSEIDASAYL